MDQLAAYSSDSSDPDFDKDGETENDCKDNTSQKYTRSRNSCTQYKNSFDETGSESNISTRDITTKPKDSSGINFFGFSSFDSKQKETELSDDEEEKERLILVQGNSLEVPDGDFWRDFSEVEAASVDSEGNTESRKRKFLTPTKPSNQSAKLEASDTLVAKRHKESSLVSWPHNPHHPEKPQNEPGKAVKNSAGTSNFQADSSAKIYAVHPRVSPHLNHQQSSRCPSKENKRWASHTSAINRINWCRCLSYSHLLLSASMDGTVRVWNAWGQQQPCLRTLTTHTKAVRDAQWSRDGMQILSCSYDRTAAITNVQTGQCLMQFEHSNYVSAGKYHPVSPHLVTTGSKDSVQVWDTRHPDVPIRILTHKEELGQVQDLIYSSNGQELFTCGDVVTRESADRSIVAWDFRTGVILSNQIFQERYTATQLYLHPSNSQFLAQTQAGYIAVFSTQRPYKMNKSKRFEGHKSAGYNIGLSMSQDGNILYSGSSDGKFHCYNFTNGRRIRTLDSGGQILMDVTAHPVLPSVVAGATWDGDIVLFQ